MKNKNSHKDSVPYINEEEINDSAAQMSSDSNKSQEYNKNERNENFFRSIKKMEDSIIKPSKTQIEKKDKR